MLKNIFTSVVNFIFPPRCFICYRFVQYYDGLCSECWRSAEFISGNKCQCCGLSLDNYTTGDYNCGKCLLNKPLYSVSRSVFIYGDYSKKLILRLKFSDATNIASLGGRLMARYCSEILNGVDYVVPIPLHKLRLFNRKYNQSLLLAIEFLKNCEQEVRCIPDLLYRSKYTKPQALLEYKERIKNMTDVFKITDKYTIDIKDKVILLIDDVMTTGATMDACVKLLLKIEVKEVRVLTLARTQII